MATHIIECSSPELLPFARSRIKAIRATGLKYASQTFDAGIGSVHVRVVGEHDYISISGSDGSIWMIIRLATSTDQIVGSNPAVETVTRNYSSLEKTWVIRTSINLSSARRFYYGETQSNIDSISYGGDAGQDGFHENQTSSTTALKGSIGAVTYGAFYSGSMILSGVLTSPVSIINTNFYYAVPNDWVDSTWNINSTHAFLVAGNVYSGTDGSIGSSHQLVSGTHPDATYDNLSTSSGLYVTNVYHTHHKYAHMAGKLDGVTGYWKIPFNYSGVPYPPTVWEAPPNDPPDKVDEYPHSPLYFPGYGVDWATWIGLKEFIGHPVTGLDKGKLWKIEIHDAVLHGGDPTTSTVPMSPATGYLDLRDMPAVKGNAELLEAFNDDYDLGGEFSTSLNSSLNSAIIPFYLVGRKTVVSGSVTSIRSLSVTITSQPP